MFVIVRANGPDRSKLAFDQREKILMSFDWVECCPQRTSAKTNQTSESNSWRQLNRNS